jgi:hypothetical protein
MKRAWIVTLEGTTHREEVIAILSGRKGGRTVKEYVEWLFALLNCGPAEHFFLANRGSSANPFQATFSTTNTGASVENMMFCGHNPFLVARLARDIQMIDPSSEEPILKWTDPDRLICDKESLHIKEKIPGKRCEAPVRLPLAHLYSMRIAGS